MDHLRSTSLWRLSTLLILASVAFLIISCGDDDDPAAPSGNQAPAAPVLDTAAGAPADGAINVGLGVQLHWTCSDPDVDALTYAVRFGTSSSPVEVAADHATTSYTPAGLDHATTYYWQVVASDGHEHETESAVWSFTTIPEATEVVSQPSAPTGPVSGLTGELLTFSASGSSSSFGSPVQYRFDWGNGSTSSWSANTLASIDMSYAWANAGTFDVKVQARSGDDPAIESAWSAAISVTVDDPPAETISIGAIVVTGPDNTVTGVAADFTFSGFVESSEGHATEWRWAWGDGEYSDWIVVKEGSHVYASEGDYVIGLQGRCSIHTSATYERTDIHTVQVAAGETVSAPGTVSGLGGHVYSQYSYWVEAHATNSAGHAIELQYDFGDGVTSDWTPEYTRASHTWSLGTYDIVAQARCVEHPEIVSEWGTVLTKEFEEQVAGLGPATGPATGTVGVPVDFTADPATSNEGHALEYEYFYRRSGSTTYTNGGFLPSPDQSITWDTAGTYYVGVRVRCALHPEVTSSNNAYATIVISP